MNKKIAAGLFRHASESGVKNMVIASRKSKVVMDYYFSDGTSRSFSLPQKMEQELFADLRQLLNINPGELASEKLVRLAGPQGRLDFHVTITPDRDKEKIMISILDRNQRNWRLNQLGLQNSQKKEINNFLNRRSGLLIVSSPPGHGKSATAFALAAETDSEKKDIYALEDWPETTLDGVNSLKQTPDNWARILKHDSDFIVADSLENEENLKNAFRAAESGRLVVGTMAADSSFEVLAKILKIDLPLKLKLDNLKMIINQRLEELNASLRHRRKNIRLSIGLFEILKMTPRLKTLITKGGDKTDRKFWENLITAAINEGFQPLETDRKKKTKSRIIKN